MRTFNKDRAIPSAGGPRVTADEGTAAVLEFDNGAIGVLESSVVATGRKNFLCWEINGSHGSLRWDLEHPNSLFACLEGQRRRVSARLHGDLRDRELPSLRRRLVAARAQHRLGALPHIIEKFHFLDAVANDKPLSPRNATFEDGYRVAVIIDAMRQSSRLGQKVHPVF